MSTYKGTKCRAASGLGKLGRRDKILKLRGEGPLCGSTSEGPAAVQHPDLWVGTLRRDHEAGAGIAQRGEDGSEVGWYHSTWAGLLPLRTRDTGAAVHRGVSPKTPASRIGPGSRRTLQDGRGRGPA